LSAFFPLSTKYRPESEPELSTFTPHFCWTASNDVWTSRFWNACLLCDLFVRILSTNPLPDQPHQQDSYSAIEAVLKTMSTTLAPLSAEQKSEQKELATQGRDSHHDQCNPEGATWRREPSSSSPKLEPFRSPRPACPALDWRSPRASPPCCRDVDFHQIDQYEWEQMEVLTLMCTR